MARIARLPERGYVAVEGPDAEKFLQGLITNDMEQLKSARAIHAGLLSPQGKILFEFMVVRTEGGFDLETERARAPDLVKRLGLYRLRAKVEIADRADSGDVYAAWGEGPSAVETDGYIDPRLAALGRRFQRPADAAVTGTESASAYHAHRIALGVPEASMDYVLGDTFPHEACLDLLSGVAFDKGCFVGQEVVSRMEHRGSARKRFVIAHGASTLPPAQTEITAATETGRAVIGTMGSSVGQAGLALVRLDRVSEALQAGFAFSADAVEVSLTVPSWAPYALPAAK